MNSPEPADSRRLDRRSAIKWMLAATASVALMERASMAAEGAPTVGVGYGTDPDLVKIYKPGDVWALTFTDPQRRTATALCDAIIPADDKSPAASKVGVPDFIDEWISAPYPGHTDDKRTVLEGLAWIDEESQKRFGNNFADLVLKQKNAICDDICAFGKAKPEFKKAAGFFRKFRDLTAGGFYSTPEGMKDIGYVGNVPTVDFAGPTPEALKHLGLA